MEMNTGFGSAKNQNQKRVEMMAPISGNGQEKGGYDPESDPRFFVAAAKLLLEELPANKRTDQLVVSGNEIYHVPDRQYIGACDYIVMYYLYRYSNQTHNRKTLKIALSKFSPRIVSEFLHWLAQPEFLVIKPTFPTDGVLNSLLNQTQVKRNALIDGLYNNASGIDNGVVFDEFRVSGKLVHKVDLKAFFDELDQRQILPLIVQALILYVRDGTIPGTQPKLEPVQPTTFSDDMFKTPPVNRPKQL